MKAYHILLPSLLLACFACKKTVSQAIKTTPDSVEYYSSSVFDEQILLYPDGTSEVFLEDYSDQWMRGSYNSLELEIRIYLSTLGSDTVLKYFKNDSGLISSKKKNLYNRENLSEHVRNHLVSPIISPQGEWFSEGPDSSIYIIKYFKDNFDIIETRFIHIGNNVYKKEIRNGTWALDGMYYKDTISTATYTLSYSDKDRDEIILTENNTQKSFYYLSVTPERARLSVPPSHARIIE